MDKKDKKPNVPNLRFEYDKQWKSGILDNLCQFYKGSGLSKNDLSNDGSDCILYGQLYTTYSNEVITNIISKTKTKLENPFYSKINDLIIPSSGEDPIDIAVARSVQVDNVILGGDLNVLRPNNEINSTFLSYQLNGKRKKDIAKIAQGKSIVHLHNNDLRKIKIYYPDIKEQYKISDLLFKIDKLITTQIKIIDSYKLLINVIRDKLIYPSGLKERKLKSFIKIYNGYAFKSDSYIDNGSFKIVTIGNVTGERYINKNNLNTINDIPEDIQTHQVLHKGSILVSLTGNVGRVSICDIDTCLLNQRVALVCPINVNEKYIYHILSSTKFRNHMISLSQGAAQKNIGITDILNYTVPVSSSDEIEKIVNSLENIEEKICIEMKILIYLQYIKSYLLKNMFV